MFVEIITAVCIFVGLLALIVFPDTTQKARNTSMILWQRSKLLKEGKKPVDMAINSMILGDEDFLNHLVTSSCFEDKIDIICYLLRHAKDSYISIALKCIDPDELPEVCYELYEKDLLRKAKANSSDILNDYFTIYEVLRLSNKGEITVDILESMYTNGKYKIWRIALNATLLSLKYNKNEELLKDISSYAKRRNHKYTKSMNIISLIYTIDSERSAERLNEASNSLENKK